MARLSHGVTGKMGTWQPLGQRAPLTDMQANLITFTTQAFFFLVFKEKHKRWVRPLSWANEPVQPQRVPHAKGSHTWFVLCFHLKSLNNFWMRFPTFSFCTGFWEWCNQPCRQALCGKLHSFWLSWALPSVIPNIRLPWLASCRRVTLKSSYGRLGRKRTPGSRCANHSPSYISKT